MSSPEQPQPRYQSSQAQATEESLAAAESSLAPTLATLLLAYISAQGAAGAAEAATPSPGTIARGALIPAEFITNYASHGLKDYVEGGLRLMMMPFLLFNLRNMAYESRTILPKIDHDNAILPIDFHGVASEAVERSIRLAVPALANAEKKITEKATGDLYTQELRESDSRSASQRLADTVATRTTRWVLRDALFEAQTSIATQLGFTHKRWITEADDRVRDSHKSLHGRVAKAGGVFQTTGGILKYPGDITAPLHLTMNCRCSLEWIRR